MVSLSVLVTVRLCPTWSTNVMFLMVLFYSLLAGLSSYDVSA